MSWKPLASLSVLQYRATLYHHLRAFFLARDVFELDVPILSSSATIDPFIDSIHASVMGRQQYLQTSPEFYLKRFLSAYPHDVYYLGKAFRDGEKGSRHNPEFTMLEWYRMGWDEQALLNEVRDLLLQFIPDAAWQIMSYRAVFQQYLGVDPHLATVDELSACAQERIDSSIDFDTKNPWLDLLFTHCIEPALPKGFVGIYDYPASQAALARCAEDELGQTVAKRFEVYFNGMELANGYCELSDAAELQRRFIADQQYRQQHQLATVPFDDLLVDALNEGQFPDCAGVALGVDRLLMCVLGKKKLQDVLSFTA